MSVPLSIQKTYSIGPELLQDREEESAVFMRNVANPTPVVSLQVYQ